MRTGIHTVTGNCNCIVIQGIDNASQPLLGSSKAFPVQVCELKDGEPIEGWRQAFDLNCLADNVNMIIVVDGVIYQKDK